MDLVTKIGLLWLLFFTVLTFIICGWDKFAAGRQLRRVPEKVLFLLSALGGSIGMYAGMLTFRHKTQHWYFKFGTPAILLAQIVLVLIVYRLFFI